MLKEELDKFWKWAGISSEEYANGSTPAKNLPVEWEGHYPNWIQLERSFRDELKRYKKDADSNHLRTILEFVAIDNESGTAQDILLNELDNTQKKTFAKVGYKFYMPQTRWQVAEFLRESDVSNKTTLLEEMISSDRDKYVQRMALLSLTEIAPKLACKNAYEKLGDDDEYMRLVSIRILKVHDPERFPNALKVLSNDPSNLVREEIFNS
ncbi:MAG: HEAT repeat domain-containing protein [Bacteroidota bacterium]